MYLTGFRENVEMRAQRRSWWRLAARLLMTCCLLSGWMSLAHAADSPWTITYNDANHINYTGDFDSSAAAEQACNQLATPYGFTCNRAGGPPDSVAISFSAGWIRISQTDSIGISAYYCELPYMHIPGSHKCVGSIEIPNSDPKNNGCPKCEGDPKKPGQPTFGNPINPGTGNKIQREVDFAGKNSVNSLRLERIYNSRPFDPISTSAHLFGGHWTTSYDTRLVFEPQRNTIKCYLRKDDQSTWCFGKPSSTAGVAILRPDAKIYRFSQNGANWVNDADVNDRLVAQYAADGTTVLAWSYTNSADDSTEQYDTNGRLISIASRSGAVQYLTYSDGTTNDTSASRLPAGAPVCSHVQAGAPLPAGSLLCVTDNWGSQLQFEHDALGRVVKAFDPNGQEYEYTYDGASGGCPAGSSNNACPTGNLTIVGFPGGANRTYWYNEAAQINSGTACANANVAGSGFGHLYNALTGIIDENGARFATWTYDCTGNATSSQHAGGVEKVVMSYAAPTGSTFYNSVTYTFGSPAAPATVAHLLTYAPVLGVPKFKSFGGHCLQCGPYSSAAYDANGNFVSVVDWKSNMNCYGYDLTRNLETVRVEGAPSGSTCSTLLTATTLSSPQRRITTQWHASYRVPVLIAEPLQIVTFTYDAAGNLLTRTEQATTDASGVLGAEATTTGPARTWTYTYNSVGQVLTVTGPRTDVKDSNTYAYDGQGNLTSVTNAAGQSTTLSNYNANGRVGRITDANGTSVDLTYHPRGWVSSRSVTAGGVTLTTSFDYDGVGQLKKVTLPDGSYVTNTYDDAHRLTDIADSLGNSIHYTLDYWGNRITEQSSDVNGVLSRQISRVYDTLNQLTKVTGGAQ